MRKPDPKTTPLRSHRLEIEFEPLGPHWMGGNRLETHMLNALGILFPLGERFFVRAVREAIPRITDPEVVTAAKGFIAQEVHHAYQHERSFKALEAHGLKPRAWAERVEKFLTRRVEPRLSLVGRLSVTAALEQFTAAFADYAFRVKFFDIAEPSMRELFLWHAAEELEHKSVAFDVLRAVQPSYAARIAGMAFAWPLFVGLWYGVAICLLAGDRSESAFTAVKQWCTSALRGRLALKEMVVAVRDYLRPGFHPSHDDNLHYAEEYFAGWDEKRVSRNLTRDAHPAYPKAS